MASSNQPAPKGGDTGQQGGSGTSQERAAALTRQQALGRQLRTLFDEVKNEPIPPTMLQLLDELESKDEWP